MSTVESHPFAFPILFPPEANVFLQEHQVFLSYGLTQYLSVQNELVRHVGAFCARDPEMSIGNTYLLDVFRDVMEKPSTHAIVFLHYDDSHNTNDILLQIRSIVGFMISQIGECSLPEYANIPVLNLICIAKMSDIQKKMPSARILMFTYLFTLKEHGYLYGLLELAHNYRNISGLKAYSKFGFRERLSLKEGCFDYYLQEAGIIESQLHKQQNPLAEQDTLPMLAFLFPISVKELIDTMIHNTYIEHESLDLVDPLCRQSIVKETDWKKRRKYFLQIIQLLRLPKYLQDENKKANKIPVEISMARFLNILGGKAREDKPKLKFVEYTSPLRTRTRTRTKSTRYENN